MRFGANSSAALHDGVLRLGARGADKCPRYTADELKRNDAGATRRKSLARRRKPSQTKHTRSIPMQRLSLKPRTAVSRGGSEKGFTLAEVLVVLAMLSLLTVLTLNITGPWIAFRAQAETDQQLLSIHSAVEAYYETNSAAIESAGPTGGNQTFGIFVNNPYNAGNCPGQTGAFQQIAVALPQGPAASGRDAYRNNYCVMVRTGSATVDGVTVHHRAVAFISPGRDGAVSAATTLEPTTMTLTLDGDDRGIVFATLPSVMKKLAVTRERLSTVARTYEIFFTARFLANSSRDLTVYYFSAGSGAGNDTGNPVATTSGNWAPVRTALSPIGIGADLSVTPWGTPIEVGNHSETVAGLQVRTPDSAGFGQLPYTALLRAALPTPPGFPQSYAARLAVGGY